MARLYDIIRSKETQWYSQPPDKIESDSRIVVDDCYNLTGSMDQPWSEYAPIRPPFNRTWMEYCECPTEADIKERLADPETKRLFDKYKLSVENSVTYVGGFFSYATQENITRFVNLANKWGAFHGGVEAVNEDQYSQCEGIIVGEVFSSNKNMAARNGFTIVGVDKNFLIKSKLLVVLAGVNPKVINAMGMQYMIDEMGRMSKVFIYAMALMNCKNIILERQCPYDEALQKARVRRGKLPFFDYHVLRIDPSKTRTKTIGGPMEHDSDPKRLHICRGHFKTYTTERPLFGRLTGTFWVPQHMRGDIDTGVVAKDYQVVMPRGTENGR